MKNILLLVPRMNIGGAESYVALVARSLKSLGYNIFIASAGGALAVELQKEGIKHFFLPIRLSKFISGLLLKRIVEKYNIDLIHANSEAAGIVAVKTRNKYKLDIPIVYTAHGVLPAKVKDIMNQVDKIIAVSEFSRKSAIKEGFLAEKIQVIYNGVDTDKFKPNRQNKNLLRKKYNIPQEAFTMIIVSRIKNLRNKGHQHLLDVLKNYDYSDNIMKVVLYHHECYDGSGYPDNLKGTDIPLGARILKVTDEFAALISERPYRKAFDIDTAVNILIEEIKNLDMRVFIEFQRMIHEEETFEIIRNSKVDLENLSLKDILSFAD